jgi:PilZ domain
MMSNNELAGFPSESPAEIDNESNHDLASSSPDEAPQVFDQGPHEPPRARLEAAPADTRRAPLRLLLVPAHNRAPMRQAQRSDRRAHPRIPGPFHGAYSGALSCRISNLSAVGCFVECLHPMDKGIVVALRIELPGDEGLAVSGEILYKEPRMGFAVRFVDLTAEQSEKLERMVSQT